MNYTTLEHAYERCNVLDADGVANVTVDRETITVRMAGGVSTTEVHTFKGNAK